MKILLLEVDSFSYSAEKCLKSALESEYREAQTVKNTTVLYITIEKNDTIEEFLKIKLDIKTNSIVLYPFAHLSIDGAIVEHVKPIMDLIEKELSKKYVIYRASIGWAKKMSIESPAEGDCHFYDSEDEIWADNKSGISGKLYAKNVSENITSEVQLAKKVSHSHTHKEVTKSNYFQFLAGAHSGQICLNPRGTRLYKYISKYCESIFEDGGYLPVVTPHVWSKNTKYIKKYYSIFPNRQFTCKEQGIFRIAACLGMFNYFKTNYIYSRNLPIGYYEIGPMYRFEQRGELKSASRLRVFTMTDLHVFTTKKTLYSEIEKIATYIKTATEHFLNKEYLLIIRYTKDFEIHKLRVMGIIENLFDVPICFEKLQISGSYWCFKLEVTQIQDNVCLQLGTLQIDEKNAANMDLKIYDDKGINREQIYILHVSPIGSIERLIYAIEKTHIHLPKYLSEYRLIVFHDLDLIKNKIYTDCLHTLSSKYRIKTIDIELKNIKKQLSKLKLYDFAYYIVCTELNIEKDWVILTSTDGNSKHIKFSDLINEI